MKPVLTLIALLSLLNLSLSKGTINDPMANQVKKDDDYRANHT